jgi:hypothetical protein
MELQKVTIDQKQFDLHRWDCKDMDELKRAEATYRAEYRRLQELATTFWNQAKAVKAELDWIVEEREALEKERTEVTRVARGRSGKPTAGEKAFQLAMEYIATLQQKNK